MSEQLSQANPGSVEAKASGCLCPSQDNNHGQGIWMGALGRQFIRRLDCPLHGEESGAVLDIVPLQSHERVNR